jgi:hypothetical protein
VPSAGAWGDCGSGSRYQQPRFLPIVLERPGTGETAKARGWGVSEGTRADAMDTSDRLADNCGDEAMTHAAVSQRWSKRRRDLSL